MFLLRLSLSNSYCSPTLARKSLAKKIQTWPSGYGLLGKIRGKAGAQAWEMGRCLAFLAEPLGTPNTLPCLDPVFRGAICLRAIKKFRMSHHPWPVPIMWQLSISSAKETLIWVLESRSPKIQMGLSAKGWWGMMRVVCLQIPDTSSVCHKSYCHWVWLCLLLLLLLLLWLLVVGVWCFSFVVCVVCYVYL